MTINIMHGDCREVIGNFGEEYFDAVIMSPPYWRDWKAYYQTNIIDPNIVGREPYFDTFALGLCSIFNDMKRALKPNGIVCLNYGDRYKIKYEKGQIVSTERIMDSHEILTIIIKQGWYLLMEIIWFKPNFMSGEWPTGENLPHEKIFVLSKQPAAIKDLRNYNSVWIFNNETYEGYDWGVLPEMLVDRLLDDFIIRKGKKSHILDPFSGSGTVGVVASKRGHHATLIERDINYVNLSKRRIDSVGKNKARII